MRIELTVAVLLGSFLFCGIVPAQKAQAPLPEALVSARTAFLVDNSGDQKYADAVYAQLLDWGRWQIVTRSEDADVIISLDHRDGFQNNFFLVVADRRSGQSLWTGKRDVAVGTRTGVAKAFVGTLRARMPGPSGK